MNSVLTLRNIHKTFNRGTVAENHVLKGIDLDLQSGDYVTIIGGNGAGKSTLLNIISGTHIPETGTVCINGQDVTKKPEHKRAADISRVFQDPMLGTASDMTIAENLALALHRGERRPLKRAVREGEKELFKTRLSDLGLGLENRVNESIGLLSGGQRQAVTLLMAILKRPQLLLLDEHTAALDPKTARIVLDFTDRIIRQEGLTALMITHNMKDAIEHGNRLIMMNEGRIVLDVKGEEKKKLTVSSLTKMFASSYAELFMTDNLILTGE